MKDDINGMIISLEQTVEMLKNIEMLQSMINKELPKEDNGVYINAIYLALIHARHNVNVAKYYAERLMEQCDI